MARKRLELRSIHQQARPVNEVNYRISQESHPEQIRDC